MLFAMTSNGTIELQLERGDAEACSHSGDCLSDVQYTASLPYVKTQLAAIDPAELIEELEEYGLEDLFDHEDNLLRILWILAGDMVENTD